MKMGDLVKVSFGLNGVDSITGIFIRDDTKAVGESAEGFRLLLAHMYCGKAKFIRPHWINWRF